MNVVDEFRQDEQRVLDRLVDGELGVHERRELLAALDDEPGAWRRCGLAFLEAQSWRWQMSRMATEPILAQLSASRPKRLAGRRAWWGGFLAIAASLVVAFAVGTRFPTLGPGVNVIASDGPALQVVPQPHTVSRPDSQPAINNLADATDTGSPTPWQTWKLTPVGAGGDEDAIEVRVVADPTEAPLDEQTDLASYLPGLFEEEGWEVNRRVRFLPFTLSDGRQVVVPVEEVDLRRPEVFQF